MNPDLNALLRGLQPVLNPGTWVFTCLPGEAALGGVPPLATLREAEGLTAVLPETQALALGLPILFRAAWITLNVNSELQAVGLTAAFSSALAAAGISCNVLAGACHDHLFVPLERADEALAVLRQLQADACSTSSS